MAKAGKIIALIAGLLTLRVDDKMSDSNEA